MSLIPVRDPSEIPEFETDAERAEFWQTHQVADELWEKLPKTEEFIKLEQLAELARLRFGRAHVAPGERPGLPFLKVPGNVGDDADWKRLIDLHQEAYERGLWGVAYIVLDRDA